MCPGPTLYLTISHNLENIIIFMYIYFYKSTTIVNKIYLKAIHKFFEN